VLKFTGPKGYFKALRFSKNWRETMLNTQSEHRKKIMNQLMKNYCFSIWPAKICTGNRKFLESFQSYRNMLQHRPKVRFDGIYMCKMIYYRKGISEVSDRRPLHEVVSYRYIRFYR